MLDDATNILFRANTELEQLYERMSRNCNVALEIIQGMEMQDLSPESREQLYSRVHTLREIVRILSSDFEEKLLVATARSGRALSRDEVILLLYGLDEL
jgi:hypothetical protein